MWIILKSRIHYPVPTVVIKTIILIEGNPDNLYADYF